jgi:hypothetical protein
MSKRGAATLSTTEIDDARTLKILTWNVGLLRLRICGVEVFSNPPFADQRLPYIPDMIRKKGADIIALQECYESAHAEMITDSLKDIYPYCARVDSGGVARFHNALMLLSR